MPVNLDKPHLWKPDIARSVDMYNDWFINFAPRAFRETRVGVTKDVERALKMTKNLMDVEPSVLQEHPEVLSTLRMATCPPLAVDRLIGLASVSANLVKSMEKQNRLPTRTDARTLNTELKRIGEVIKRMVDPDIFVWLGREKPATKKEV